MLAFTLTMPDGPYDPNSDSVVRSINDKMYLGELAPSEAIGQISGRQQDNVKTGAIIIGVSAGAVLGAAYVAAMGEAAAAIYEGYSVGMGGYALLVNGGRSTAIIAGGLEAGYAGVNGIPGAGPGFAGMEAKAAMVELSELRLSLGLKPGVGTLAKLEVGGGNFFGINAHGQNITMSVNAISRTHAEADAFQQAINAGATGSSGMLYIDRALCLACGQNGGVRGMARQLGLTELRVVTPSNPSGVLLDLQK